MWVTIVVALTTTGYELIMLTVLIFIFQIISITCDMLYYQLKVIINELLAIRNYVLPVTKNSGRD